MIKGLNKKGKKPKLSGKGCLECQAAWAMDLMQAEGNSSIIFRGYGGSGNYGGSGGYGSGGNSGGYGSYGNGSMNKSIGAKPVYSGGSDLPGTVYGGYSENKSTLDKYKNHDSKKTTDNKPSIIPGMGSNSIT